MTNAPQPNRLRGVGGSWPALPGDGGHQVPVAELGPDAGEATAEPRAGRHRVTACVLFEHTGSP